MGGGPAPPTVNAVNPASGPTSGGTSVTITGTNVAAATAVNFGPNGATNVNLVSSTQITGNLSAGFGMVDVTVTTPSGTSATSTADQFTYNAPPPPPPPSAPPAVSGGAPATVAGTGATVSGTVNPEGVATTAFFVRDGPQLPRAGRLHHPLRPLDCPAADRAPTPRRTRCQPR